MTATLLLLWACHAPGTDTSGGDTDVSVGDSADSTAPADSGETGDSRGDTGPAPRLDLAGTTLATSGHFATALACSDCHGNSDTSTAMRDAAGRPVGAYDLWRGSMMANAARDPFWWASVAYEEEPWGLVYDDIEASCTVCHAPALAAESRLTGAPLPTMATLQGIDAQAVVGLDGVTCTVCHQVEADGLGAEETFDGAFVTAGAGLAYGLYDDPVDEGMTSGSGYAPAAGAHLADAGLCASCHMVETTVLGFLGEPTSRHFDEQQVYREWLASDFGPAGATHVTCQACHMPVVDEDGVPITTVVSRDPTGADQEGLPARSPYGRHSFLGGNAYVLSLLRDNAAELAPGVPPEVFDVQVDATRAFLRTAARLTVGGATRDGDTLSVPITVENLTGHKLPTGFPSRRMWLDVTVTDASGAVVLRSGATDVDGRLVDAAGAPLPEETFEGPLFPHRDALTDGQVQVWETALLDRAQLPVFMVLVATSAAKDDRILPAGWVTDDDTLESVGVAGDTSFLPGGDTVTLLVDAPASAGPFTVHAALRYQPIGARHLAEVLMGELEPVRVFERMVEASDRTPDTMAEVSATVE